ncbi:hypothetical protein DFH07DRAFT_936061 [Mycena maculata]|uniref:Uncharacterized protein n=1 Tax=Mycena maculata TaxID=230809 RepID=A0AAD7K817_9AGAR|nr:hypothetical protein DFH07DRAFT_1066147 [Mycena maculata]KAJ7780112.1 hypothetical protein DFH07DRAFT_936061 [Mycena maculata]
MPTLLERAALRRQQEQQNTPSQPPAQSSASSSLPNNPQLDSSPLNPFVNAPSYVLATRPGGSQARLRAFGDRALKRVKLEEESAAEFNRYLETTDPEERNTLQFMHTLALKDMLNKSVEERGQTWEPSAKLAKTIRKFIWALLLLPNIQYYSGTVESAVISAMRACNVKELPKADSLECDELTSHVGKEFSNARYAMKKAILASRNAKKIATRNIADLAADILRHCSDVKATRGLYMRLALLRQHTTQGHTPSEFWTKVDDELEELHNSGPVLFVESLDIAYSDDIQTYGDPATSNNRIGSDITESSPKYLQQLSSLAPKIQRSKKQGTKRRRQADPEEEEEGEGGGEEPETQQGPAQQEDFEPAHDGVDAT